MRLQFMLGEIWIGLRRNLSIAVSVMLVTTVSLYLLGPRPAGPARGRHPQGLLVRPHPGVDLHVRARLGRGQLRRARPITEQQKAALKAQLDQMKPLVKNVYYESEQQAYDRFQEQFRNSPLASNIRVGDIPQSYRVQLSDPTKYDVVVSAFQGAPGVGRVQDQQKTLDKLFKVMNGITVASLVLAFIMIICAVLLMVDDDPAGRLHPAPRDRDHEARRGLATSRSGCRSSWRSCWPPLVGVGAAIGLLWATTQLPRRAVRRQGAARRAAGRHQRRLAHRALPGRAHARHRHQSPRGSPSGATCASDLARATAVHSPDTHEVCVTNEVYERELPAAAAPRGPGPAVLRSWCVQSRRW